MLFTSVPEVYADIHKFPEDKTHWCGFYRHKLRIISWKFNFFKKEKISFDPNSQCDNPCCPINNQWVLTTSGSWVFSLCFCQVAQFGKCKSRNLKAFICVVFLCASSWYLIILFFFFVFLISSILSLCFLRDQFPSLFPFWQIDTLLTITSCVPPDQPEVHFTRYNWRQSVNEV